MNSKRNLQRALQVGAFGLWCILRAHAEDSSHASTAAFRLPVKEVTVFKDGHAFVVQEGPAKVDSAGAVTLDELPAPVMGTFWTFSTDTNVQVTSVTAGQRISPILRTALSLRELIEANPGSEAIITETNQSRYEATVIGFPTRSTEELAATSIPNSLPQLPQKGNLVLLKTLEGTKALPLEQIQTITFKREPKAMGSQEEFRNFLNIKLERSPQSSSTSAQLGLMYLQKGIRWIPSYKIDLDGEGHALVKLQATVINDMLDLTNVTLNLVIGVPSFAFKDTLDPMALQDTAAQLSQFFQSPRAGGNIRGQSLANFSNAIMSQSARMGELRAGAEAPSGPPSDLPEGAKNEDLYVFTLNHITLRKGERMVFSVGQTSAPYRDVFTLDLPFAPPAELERNLATQQQMELARLINAPTAMHKARLSNTGKQPFTTAPALILRNGKVIAQGMMTYTAPGASSDIALTTAVDIRVKKTEMETKRTPDAFVNQGDHYMRVDLKGQIHLVNHRGKPVEIEVTRFVLGSVDEVDHEGRIELANAFEDREYLPAGGQEGSPWWGWFNWPWWWNRVNGVGRVVWQVKLDPDQSVDLGYTWHYFWR